MIFKQPEDTQSDLGIANSAIGLDRFLLNAYPFPLELVERQLPLLLVLAYFPEFAPPKVQGRGRLGSPIAQCL